MMMFVYKNWNDIAKGCFQRFTWELKIGEDMAGNGPVLGKSTEPGKTKILSGVIYRIRPDGTRRYDNTLHGRQSSILTEKPRAVDDFC
jgi:hypothetical protein